jgi:endoglucanase
MDFFGTRTSGDTSVYSSTSGTAASYTGSPSDYIVSSTYLDRVEEVINWALNENLIVILDFHGATLKDEFIDTFDPVIQGVSNPLYTDPTSAKRAADNEKFRAIWSQIAERLKNYSYNLLFEIINEPYFRMSASEMDTLNSDIISVIRSTGNNNTDRNIIITGGSENSYEAPLQISPTVIASDDNLIATFHYYWPRAFTASGEETHNDYDWGTTTDKTEIDTNFGAVQSWSQTNSIPVFLGEFGADNEGGYDYDSETYGSFGGPENASRVEYHKYLAEKALELGFAFAAWDAGQKASKTIYLESTRSWVVDVRNALLGVNCLTSGVITNADIECGYDTDWDLFTQNGALATNTNASVTNVRSGDFSMEINITTAGTALNNVILRNPEINDPSVAGKLLTYGVYAKGTTGIQEFKIRLKLTAGGTTSFPASSKFTLTTDYELYEFEYQMPSNTTDVQLQLIMGTSSGVHYFDDFSVAEQTLEVNDIASIDELLIYPNPARNNVNIRSSKNIINLVLYDLKGSHYALKNRYLESFELPYLQTGTYFLRIYFDDQSNRIKQLVIN